MPVDLAIRSTRVITPQGERPATILVGEERFVAIADYDDAPVGTPLDDWQDFPILPGLIDTHVHCNEPGRTDWEGFETATKSAAMGGITTIVDMPLNSSPVTTTVAAFQEKLDATKGKLNCDVGFWGGIVPENVEHIHPLAEAGVLGFKAFLSHSGIDEFPNASPADLRAAAALLAKAGLPLLAHAELVSAVDAIPGDPRSYATWLRCARLNSNRMRFVF